MVNLTPYEGQMAIWNAAVSDIFPGGTCKLRLFQNNYVPSINSVLGDFVEATFDGYAEATFLPPVGPVLDPITSEPYVYRGPITFTDTGATTPNVIYGWYIVDTSPPNLLVAGRFDAPYTMDANGKTINLFFDFREAFTQTDTALLP